MSELPETIWTCNHVGEYGQYFPEAVEAEGEYGGTAVSYRRADVPPTLSAAMELPEVKELVWAFKVQNELMRSALEIAKREGINGEIGTTNWDAYYNKVAVSLKRSASALAAIKEPKT